MIVIVETKKRVLVVDDEPRILHFVRVNLMLAGFDVVTATSGEEALRLLESAPPDIMLLDVIMTPMSGLDVLCRLRASSQLPVIVFTGRGELGTTALREGANDYIGKPFRPEELTRKIRSILGE